jgi:uncharacterized LabA/DUF88 family protein
MHSFPRSETQRLALLIDAENASPRIIEPLLNEAAKFGTVNVRRIYGDWTRPDLATWKERLNKFAIQPIQQFRYTTGKNCSDSALIIDAMDLLHSAKFDGFCIVSSDSDFTRLACRLREAGVSVYGFGENKTPEPFVRACDRFIFVENLSSGDHDAADLPKAMGQSARTPIPGKVAALGPEQRKLIHAAYNALAPEGGYVTLAQLGSQVVKLSPSFDSRTYGYTKLSELVSAIDDFEIDNRIGDKKSGLKHPYVRLKS